MFRRGVFWDEGMRQGIEDWEFWYSAIAAGFHGVFNPDTSLRYRRLAGNRSSLNRSKDHLTKRYMRTKHKALLAPVPPAGVGGAGSPALGLPRRGRR